MANSYKKRNKLDLSVLGNTLFGKIGFSVTRESLSLLMEKLSILVTQSYERVCIGHDGAEWSKTFLEEVIVPELNDAGIYTCVLDRPYPKCVLTWAVTESSKKTLGIYLGRDWNQENILTIDLFDKSGKAFLEKEVYNLLKLKGKISTDKSQDYIAPSIDYIDVSLYPRYLFDKKLIAKQEINNPINIDTMFGATESVLKELNPKINILNLQSQRPRLLNYLPKPTGKLLAWCTTHPTVKSGYYFGIDGDGDSLGVFDLKENIEISPSGIALLLINHYYNVRKQTEGLIIISQAISDRVSIYAKKLGYKVKVTDKYLDEIHLQKDKNNEFLLYVDEMGRYSFGEDIPYPNPIIALMRLVELGEITKMSLGSLLDVILHKVIKKSYFYSNVLVSREAESKENLYSHILNKISNIDKVSRGNLDLIRMKDKSKISIKDNVKEGVLEIYIESLNKETTLQLSNTVTEHLRDGVNE